ncbi:MAG: hypothetical protein QME71_07750 [Dehalococcoidia bacterium]|nr:hypothetical protein [Dehalococcoidia bacterium]
MKNLALVIALAVLIGALASAGAGDVAAHQGFENCAFGNVADDDGDTLVNDGCPVVGTQGEDLNQCAAWNTWDDDGDTVANDGCFGGPPAAGAKGQPEVTNACANATDDDNMDGMINDGCPAFAAPEVACQDNQDNDGDGRINDGCPAVGNMSEGCAGVIGPPFPVLDINQCDEPPGAAVDDDGDGAGPWPDTQLNDGCPSPVGGVQALPDAPTDAGSGNTTFYAAVSAAGLLALVAVTGSGWYARRRSLR